MNKTSLEIIEEMPDKIKLKFPSIEVPINVSKRYFKKIKNSGMYLIKEEDKISKNN